MLCLPLSVKSSTSRTFFWKSMDATSQFPSRNLTLSAVLLKTSPRVLKWPNWTTRFAPGPSIFLCTFFTFVTTFEKGLIQIEHVPSKYQLTDIFTKPLPHDQYMRLRDQIMGWTSTPLAQHEGVRSYRGMGTKMSPNFHSPSSQYCLEQLVPPLYL